MRSACEWGGHPELYAAMIVAMDPL
eukprot:gene18813-24583_t